MFIGGCSGDSGAPVWRQLKDLKTGQLKEPEIVAVYSGIYPKWKWFEPICNTVARKAFAITQKVLKWIDEVKAINVA